MTAFLGALFFISLLLAADLVPWIARLARRSGFMDRPGPRKIHAAPVPYGGGLAVAAGVLGTTGLAFAWAPADVLPAPPHPPVLVYAMGALVMLALGAVDDRRKLGAWTKLGIQTVVALGVALGGERLQLFETEGGVVLGVAVTTLWIVGITNAFNLIDHLDGLCAGVAAVAGAAFLIVALQTGQILLAVLIVPLLGACLGFLLFNLPPAKIFLGDAGSLFIGFWLACLTISFTFFRPGEPYRYYTWFVPLAVLAVPLFDTSSVVLLRILQGRPVFEGDTNHLAHRLMAMGMTPARALLTVLVLTLCTGLSAVLLYHVGLAGAVLVLAQLLVTFVIITLLEVSGRSNA